MTKPTPIKAPKPPSWPKAPAAYHLGMARLMRAMGYNSLAESHELEAQEQAGDRRLAA